MKNSKESGFDDRPSPRLTGTNFKADCRESDDSVDSSSSFCVFSEQPRSVNAINDESSTVDSSQAVEKNEFNARGQEKDSFAVADKFLKNVLSSIDGRTEKESKSDVDTVSFTVRPNDYSNVDGTQFSNLGVEFEAPDDSEVDGYEVTFFDKNDESLRVQSQPLFSKSKVKPTDPNFQKVLVPLHLAKNLDENQQKQILSLCSEYADIFVRPPGQWEASKTTPLHIDTGRQLVSDETRKMLEKGVIRESKSPWQSPIVLVKKPDGTCRFVIEQHF
jgi:hypothetical protein